jgi:aspartate 1-decarboxylase
MMRIVLKSKLHGAVVTGKNLAYEGSITLDARLLKAADILPFEQVHVLNLNNGARLETYAIKGPRGVVALNGAAARLGEVGDTVIILAYGLAGYSEKIRPRIVHLGAGNRPRR